MAKIQFRGMCSGSQKKDKRDGSGSYTVTRFVEVPSMQSFDVFGDLGLPASDQVQDYQLDADIVNLRNVKLSGVPAPKK